MPKISKNNIKSTPPQSTAIVIGGGIVGLATAIYLQRSGVQVTLVEQRHIGSGASFGNASMLTNTSVTPVATPGLTKKIPYYMTSPDSPLRVKLGFLLKNIGWFFKFWRGSNPKDFEKRSHALNLLLCDVYEQHVALAKGTSAEKYLSSRSTLSPFADEASRDRDSAIWDIRRALCAGISKLDDEKLRKDMPHMNPIWSKSYLMSNFGSVLSPIKYLQALAKEFEKLGGEITYTPVLDFQTANKQVTGITTNHGILTADQYAICAGVYSSILSAKLGDTVPLTAESGYHIHIKNPNIKLKHNILHAGINMGISQMEDGIRCTSFAEYAGLGAKPSYDEIFPIMKKNLASVLPDLEIKDYTIWRGDRPSTPDSLPVIGRATHYDNVFYGFGHQHVGMSGGPKTGKILSEMMNQQATCINTEAFDVERFH